MATKRKNFDPYDMPSIRRARERWVEHVRKLMAEQGVSKIDELKLSPEASRGLRMLSPFWREGLGSG
jgi:hypothetical protein